MNSLKNITIGVCCIGLGFGGATLVKHVAAKEQRRQIIVQAYNCSQRGDAMNKWAEERGFDVPCPNVDH